LGTQWRWPVLTMVAFVVACAAAVLQYWEPAVVPALERTPSGLPHGEYWRLVTPLLVQTLGWYQVLANLVTLAVIGAVAEWVLGCRWWLTLGIAGTIGGQLAAYRWHEWGGGDSIAICGLAAGVLVAQLIGRDPPVRWAADAVLYYIVAVAGSSEPLSGSCRTIPRSHPATPGARTSCKRG
jgi:Rhomboid family